MANVARNKVEEVLAVIWGGDEEEEEQIIKIDEEREKMLLMYTVNIMNEEGMENSTVNRNEKGEIMMGRETWQALGKIRKAQYKEAMKHQSLIERKQKTTFGSKPEPKWSCQTCGKKFGTTQERVSQIARAHNYRSDQRKLAQEIQNGEGKFCCLLC